MVIKHAPKTLRLTLASLLLCGAVCQGDDAHAPSTRPAATVPAEDPLVLKAFARLTKGADEQMALEQLKDLYSDWAIIPLGGTGSHITVLKVDGSRRLLLLVEGPNSGNRVTAVSTTDSDDWAKKGTTLVYDINGPYMKSPVWRLLGG